MDPALATNSRCSARANATDVANYLDTSALVKLVVNEAESGALQEWLHTQESPSVTCDLSRTELMRAVRRVAPDLAVRARRVLDALTLTKVTTAIFEAAGRVDPPEIRSLDALHLSAALDLGDELEGFVTYDERLASAAERNGIPVLAPR